MTIDELDTPALLIDLDIMERNLSRMAAYTAAHGLRLRPHTKTHKIPSLGRRQLDLGAAGLTVAKVSEAEVMLAAEPPNLLIAFPQIGATKLRRVVTAARSTRIAVALDSLEAARPLSEAAALAGVEIGVMVEMDVGLNRVGVTPGPELYALVQEIRKLPGLRFEGLTFYPGHIKLMDDEGQAALQAVSELVSRTVESLREQGFAPGVVSGGSTPTMWMSHRVQSMTEIRPGTYIFNDMNTVVSGACTLEDCAASVLATIVSTARPGQAIIDGGSKTFSSDRLNGAAEASHGYVREAPLTRFHKLNEEHGFLWTEEAGNPFRVGDRVRVIPNHVCVAMNLHEQVYGVRGNQVELAMQVKGRGRLQ